MTFPEVCEVTDSLLVILFCGATEEPPYEESPAAPWSFIKDPNLSLLCALVPYSEAVWAKFELRKLEENWFLSSSEEPAVDDESSSEYICVTVVTLPGTSPADLLRSPLLLLLSLPM